MSSVISVKVKIIKSKDPLKSMPMTLYVPRHYRFKEGQTINIAVPGEIETVKLGGKK